MESVIDLTGQRQSDENLADGRLQQARNVV